MIRVPGRYLISSFICLYIVTILGCGKREEPKPEQKQEEKQTKNPYADAKIEIKTFKTSGGWGYDIYIWDSVYIHQPHRPAVPGSKGFNREEDARKVAEIVVKKIRNNDMPPTVTLEEMKKLGILE